MEACSFTLNEVLGLLSSEVGVEERSPEIVSDFWEDLCEGCFKWWATEGPSVLIRVAVIGSGSAMKGKLPQLHGLCPPLPRENQKSKVTVAQYSLKMPPVHSDEIWFNAQHHQHLLFLSLSRPPWFNGSNHWDVTRQENRNSGYAGGADRAQRCLRRGNAAGSRVRVQSSGDQCGSYRRHRGRGAHQPQLAAREPAPELYSGGSRSSTQRRPPLWHRGRLQVEPGPVIFFFTVITRQRQGEGRSQVQAPFLLLSSHLHGHRAVSQQVFAC